MVVAEIEVDEVGHATADDAVHEVAHRSSEHQGERQEERPVLERHDFEVVAHEDQGRESQKLVGPLQRSAQLRARIAHSLDTLLSL